MRFLIALLSLLTWLGSAPLLAQGSPPVIPSPGQTVVWSTPVLVSSSVTIPAGGTVVVAPGNTVTLASNVSLSVDGRLEGFGGGAQRTRFTGLAFLKVGGELELEDADVEVLVAPQDGGSLEFTRAAFQNGGVLNTTLSQVFLWDYPAYLRVDDCTFTGSNMRVSRCAVLLRNTSFVNSDCSLGGSLWIDEVTVDGSPLYGLQVVAQPQRVFLDDLAITNCTDAGLFVGSGNVLLGSNVTLSGNGWPVQLAGGGLLPGTSLPTTGNVTDMVKVGTGSFFGSPVILSDPGIPYAVPQGWSTGPLEVLPGVNMKLGLVFVDGSAGIVNVRGLPGNPVVIERLNPQQAWFELAAFGRLEHTLIDGGGIGVNHEGTSGTERPYPVYLDSCVIQNCDTATESWVTARKTQFLNNLLGAWKPNWPDQLNGLTGANSFEGNGLAVDPDANLIDAQNNWWGDPSGPTTSANPGGSGDPVLVGTQFQPFKTSPPDFNDYPPLVTLSEHYWLLEAGEKVILTWESSDDVGLVSHRVVFDDGTNGQVVVANLDGEARAFEWTVPDIGFLPACVDAEVRVVATDTAGQESWDGSRHTIPASNVPGDLTIQTNFAGPFVAGEHLASVCWSLTNAPSGIVYANLRAEADSIIDEQGGSQIGCLVVGMDMPFISTDTARLELRFQPASCNYAKIFFSEEFEIRPDARLGDAPPAVQLLSPSGGEIFAGGASVPITWSASDDEGVRGFHLQASYDGGRTWHFLAKDLPANATGFAFELPPSTGIADARVRVIAIDHRFQNSSAGRDVSFQIASSGAGVASFCQAKLSSIGCLPAISGNGTPSASSGLPFEIDCDQVISGRSGLLFYGFAPSALPFQGGTKCVSAPTRRTPIQSSGGNPPPADCSGSFSYDFNARIQAGADPQLVAGQDVYAQYWYRDPQSVGTTGLSNGLAFTIQP